MDDTPTLRDDLLRAICDPGQHPTPDNMKGERSVAAWQRDAVMELLNERGHVLPGCPPAARIRADAEEFAAKFILAQLTIRLLRMLNAGIVTPETKGMTRWLNDYIDGRNHGPVGAPMLWPSGLKGLAGQLRTWGFQPTPTNPPFVARRVEPVTVQ